MSRLPHRVDDPSRVTTAASRGRGDEHGFTVMELVVVTGILSSFLLMLVQLLGSGVDMYAKGQSGQDLADRALQTSRAVHDPLAAMIGPVQSSFEPRDPEARLFVHWENLGLVDTGTPRARTQIVRATVALSEAEEQALLELVKRDEAIDAAGSDEPGAVAEHLARILAGTPRLGRGEMLLLAWPSDATGEFLELRRGLFSPIEEFDLFALEEFGGEQFPPAQVERLTEVVATGLLHIDFALWSQRTRTWSEHSGEPGPEWSWDSAREGRIGVSGDARPGYESFGLDIGPGSLRDVRDDVFPRWVRATIVVARSSQEPPEARLVAPLAMGDQVLTLDRVDRMPGANDANFIKVGAEWVEFGEFDLRGRVSGLRRGQRGTFAEDHPAGTAVRVGKTVVLEVAVPHGRDAFVARDAR